MVQVFKSEEDPNVWSIMVGSLSTLHSLVQDEPGDKGVKYRSALQKAVRDLVSPTLNRLGYAAAAERV